MASPTTPMFRVSYPHVFKAQKNKLNNLDEYTLEAVFPKGTDLTALKNIVKEAAAEKWGADPKKWPQNMKTPFRNQTDKTKIDEKTGKKHLPSPYEEGGVYIRLKSKNRPRVVDDQMNEILEPSEFYAGCYARASVRAFAYDQAGNRGVSLALQNIQKLREGDPLGGASRPEDDFEPITASTEEAALPATDSSTLFG